MRKELSGVLILCAALRPLAACEKVQGQVEPPSTAVRVQKVDVVPPAPSLRYSATIEADRSVNVAFQTSGYVETILQRRGVDGSARPMQAGDAVEAGTVLARVREADYRARVDQAAGAVREVEAAHAKAGLDFERARTLFASDSLTKPELDAAAAAVRSRRRAARLGAGAAGGGQHGARRHRDRRAVQRRRDRAADRGRRARESRSRWLRHRARRTGQGHGRRTRPAHRRAETRRSAARHQRGRAGDAVRGSRSARLRRRPTIRTACSQSRCPSRITAASCGRAWSRRLRCRPIASRAQSHPVRRCRSRRSCAPEPAVATACSSSKATGDRPWRALAPCSSATCAAISVVVTRGLSTGETIVVSGPGLLADGDRVRIIP